MTAALALAEVVVARGHVGTEADTLARALIAEARRADAEALRAQYWRARRDCWMLNTTQTPPMPGNEECRAQERARIAEAYARRDRTEAAIEALGEKP